MKKLIVLICLSMFMIITEPKNILAAEYGAILDSGTSGEVSWVLYDASTTVQYKTIVISGNGSMKDYESKSERPESWTSVQAVVIEDGVTHIGDYSFDSCTKIKTVEMADSVTSIGKNAFYYSINLNEVKLSNNLKIIGDSVFTQCNIKTINMPASVISIGKSAFFGNSNLPQFDLPSNLENIGANAFYGCKKLTYVKIPEKITTIPYATFSECASLKTVVLNEGLTSIASEAFRNTQIESIKLPSTLESLGSNVFMMTPTLKSITIASGNENFKKVDGVIYNTDMTIVYIAEGSITNCNMPNTVNKINGSAFANCGELKTIYLSDLLYSIASDDFYGAHKLEEFVVSEDSKNFSVKDGVLYNKDKTVLELFPMGSSITDFVVPYGVERVENMALRNCDNLVNVTFPSTVSALGAYSIKFCLNLERVIITNPECKFSANVIYGGGHAEDRENTDIIIVGYKGSTAETEANRVKLEFEEIVMKEPLAVELNASVISYYGTVKGLKFGGKLNLSAEAKGGIGAYQYSFIIYDKDKNTWYRFDSFNDATTLVWTANSSGNKVFYVEVRDSVGAVIRSKGVDVVVVVETKEMKVSIKTNSTQVSKNETVSFTAVASGGTGEYTYSFIMYNNDQGYWHRINNFNANTVCNWYASTAGNRTFYVEVKDSSGKVARSEGIKVTVLNPLQITLNSNAGTVVKGSNVALIATASGGAGGYKYSFIMYNEEKNYWYRFSDFNGVNSLSWIASTSEKRKFYVEVKDSLGNIVRSEAVSVAIVEKYDLSVSVKSDKTQVNSGSQVKITATATGGAGNYSYSFIMYNPTTGYWHRFNKFEEGNSNILNWTASGTGVREFYVEVKDNNGFLVRSEVKKITIK